MDTKVIAGIAAAAVIGVGLIAATVANHSRTTKLRDWSRDCYAKLNNRINRSREEGNTHSEQAAQTAS